MANAIHAMDDRPTEIGQAAQKSSPLAPLPSPAPKHPMRVNDAIVIAVGAGMKTPTRILAYLADHLGVHTTLNSVRSRVSPLGQEGRIAHDETGWIPASAKTELTKDLVEAMS